MPPTSTPFLRVPHRLRDPIPAAHGVLSAIRATSGILPLRRILLPLLILSLALPGISHGQDPITSLCDIAYPSDSLIEWECVELKPGDTPRRMFGDYWEDVLRFNRVDRRHFRAGASIKVPVELDDVDGFSPLPVHYPDAEGEQKFILVDLSEMFIGAYEKGKLVESFPVAVGITSHPVPTGKFKVDAFDRRHESNLYMVEELDRPYPMHYGLRFHVDKSVDGWPSYWIHGRDLPGYPASHGCIGLYDEEMQIEYYSDHDKAASKLKKWELKKPFLRGARELFLWVVGNRRDPGTFTTITHGPPVRIIGTAPMFPPSPQ